MAVSSIIITASLLGASLLFKMGANKRTVGGRYRLLSIITSHSYGSIKTYGHEQLIVQQNSSGLFEHVFTLYSILGANRYDDDRTFTGKIRTFAIAPGHTFIECRMSFIKFLANLPRSNFVWSQVYVLLCMRKLVLDQGVGLLRGTEPFLTGLYCYVLSKLTATPFVLRIGSNWDLLHEKGTMTFERIFKWYFVEKIIARFVFPRAALVMAANRNYLEYAVANGAKEERSIVAPFGNLVDRAHFVEPSERPKIDEHLPFLGRPFGLYVGRLTKVKHAEDLLLVAQEAKKTVPGAAVVLIGDGDLREEFDKKARDLGITDAVFFLGKKRQEWIARLLPMASAYLSPHSGRSLVEAAFAGLPLIAYDWEWHAELVVPGVTGELVPYRDWKKMAESFCTMLTKKEYASELGKNARKMAMEVMDQKKIQELEKNKFLEILDRN